MAATRENEQTALDSFLSFLRIDSDHPEVKNVSMSESGPKIVLERPLDLEMLERATKYAGYDIEADLNLVEHKTGDEQISLLYKVELIDGGEHKQKIGPTFRKTNEIPIGVKSPVLSSGEPVSEDVGCVLEVLVKYFNMR